MYAETIGIAAAVGAAIAFSTASVFIKVALKDVSSPYLINGIRAVFASLIYIPLLIHSGITGITPYTLFLLIASALLGAGMGDVLFIMSIKRLGAGMATVFSYQYILIAQILSVLILHDYRGMAAIYVTPLALLGMYLAVSDGGGLRANSTGLALAYGAALSWGTATIMISHLVNAYSMPPMEVAGIRVIFLAPVLTILGVKEVRKLTRRALAILASSGVISYFVGFVLYTTSLRYLGVMIPALATSLSPVLTQIMTIKILGERFTARKIAGSLLIIASLVIVALSLR